MTTAYIGIDNGLDGGIATIYNGELYVQPMPTIKLGKGRRVDVFSIRNWIQQQPDVFVVLEGAQKFSAGMLALCSTWHSFGCIQATLELTQTPHAIVNPRDWQKMFFTKPKMPKGQKFDTKAAALQAARQIWPRQDWTKSERATKDHDGMVDAALIAQYCRRTYGINNK